jgi:hypothetical protein
MIINLNKICVKFFFTALLILSAVDSRADQKLINTGLEKCNLTARPPNLTPREVRSGVHGRVIVWFKSNTNGMIYDIGIESSSGFDVLDILSLNHILDNLKCNSEFHGKIPFDFSSKRTLNESEQNQLNLNAQLWINQWRERNLNPELISLRSEFNELIKIKKGVALGGSVNIISGGVNEGNFIRRNFNSIVEEKLGLQKLIYELNKEVAIYKNRIQEKNTILSAGSIGIQVTGFDRQCSVSRPVLNAFNGTVDYD